MICWVRFMHGCCRRSLPWTQVVVVVGGRDIDGGDHAQDIEDGGPEEEQPQGVRT